MRHHLFADDMQGFRIGDPSDISVIVTGVEDCVSDVSSWYAAKRLQLNATKTCFFHLRRLRSLRLQLVRDVMARLVSALVLSRLDYCNAVLTGLPASTLTLELSWTSDHVSPALRDLHWLPIKQSIEFKLCLLVHKSLIGIHQHT